MKIAAIVLVSLGLLCAVLAGLSALDILPSIVSGILTLGGGNLLTGRVASTLIWGGTAGMLMLSAIPFAVLSTKTM